MADDRPDETGLPADTGRPKRPPPTIDLEATDVSAEPPAADTPPDGEPSDAAPRASLLSTAIIPALCGVIAACLVIGVAWFAGWPESPPANDAPQVTTEAVDTLGARVAAIESKPANAPDPAAGARIDAVEQSIASLRGDLASMREETAKLTATIDELKTKASSPPAAAAAAAALPAVNARLDQVEQTTRTLSKEAAQQTTAASADDKRTRRVVTATLLDQVIRQGEPYAAALTAAKPLAADPAMLQPLEQFAATGVPTANALSKDLLTLIAGLAPVEAKQPESSGIIDRLKAGAERLVRIRRIDARSGEGQAAIVGRAAAAARLDDVAAARRELKTLAPADRKPFQSWIDKADARDAALAASRQLAANAVAALAKPAP